MDKIQDECDQLRERVRELEKEMKSRDSIDALFTARAKNEIAAAERKGAEDVLKRGRESGKLSDHFRAWHHTHPKNDGIPIGEVIDQVWLYLNALPLPGDG